MIIKAISLTINLSKGSDNENQIYVVHMLYVPTYNKHANLYCNLFI